MVHHRYGRKKRGKGRKCGGPCHACAACLVLSLMFVCIILAIMTLVDLEARKDAAHNAKAFAAAVDDAVIDNEVGKFLTDMRLLIKQLRGKYGELRSLMLSLFIPSLTLCCLTIL